MLVDAILDTDVVIWHLRGQPAVVDRVTELAEHASLGVSAITRAEVVLGMRDSERSATFELLDSLKTLAVDASVADRAGEIIRDFRQRGITLHLPDALIGATAILARAPLFTGNARHYPSPEIDLRTLAPM